jgi:hypothetical protein
MNLHQMRKNMGRQLHIRPLPQRVNEDGTRLPTIDDLWRLDAILDGPERLSLVNISTGHVVELQPDNVREYRSPHYLVLRCQLRLTSTGVDIEPLVPAAVQPDSEASGVPTASRSYNLPRGYEQKLNRFRFQIAKDEAARSTEGGYTFPVELVGRQQEMQAFIEATGQVSSGQPVFSQESDEKVRFKAAYCRVARFMVCSSSSTSGASGFVVSLRSRPAAQNASAQLRVCARRMRCRTAFIRPGPDVAQREKWVLRFDGEAWR